MLSAAPNSDRDWHRETVITVSVTVFIIRLAVLLIGLIATVTIDPPLPEQRHEPARALAELPNRWDAGWYIGIASGGYRYRGSSDLRWNHLAFFPAYPLALRTVARVFQVPRTPAAWAWIGVALSMIACVWASFYVYQLARQRMAETAYIAVVMLAAYPFALFFAGVYTESFFLLGSAATFWYFGQASFGRAAAWGLFTGLVRPNGALLALPLLVWAFTAGSPCRSGRRLLAAIAIAAPLFGNAAYSAYLWSLSGDPLILVSAQEGWGRAYLGLTGPAGDVLSTVRTFGVVGFLTLRPYDFMNAAAGAFTLVAIFPVARTCGLPSAVFIGVNLLPSLIVGGLPSLGRYTSVLFPVHIWLASVIAPRFRGAVIAAMSIGQGLVGVLHYTFRPMY